MIDWEKYFTEAIDLFREDFTSAFSEDEQRYVKEHLLDETLLEPCQMEIFELEGNKGSLLFLLHKTNLADMSVNLHRKATIDDVKTFHEREMEYLGFPLKGLRPFLDQKTLNWWLVIVTKTWLTMMTREESPVDFARHFLRFLRDKIKSAQVKTIEETTEELKKSIPKIPEKDREEFLEYATKIDTALAEIARIDAEVKEEIGGVRKIVGASKEFQDFKVFTSDIADLKKTHVNRDVFVAEVKRLDEKVDKGLQALNTRIEDLKAIKFWSKRTLLEIALAILAALATLYGAGVLKF